MKMKPGRLVADYLQNFLDNAGKARRPATSLASCTANIPMFPGAR